MNMHPIDTVAISKAVADKAYRTASKNLPEGEYDIDVLVQVTGHITKGADYLQNIVGKADPWALLAVALSKLNDVTVEALTREALGLSGDTVTEIKAKAKEAIQVVKDPTETKCNGKITGSVVAEIVKLSKSQAA